MMVPTAQLLSTMEEPSSGSQHTVYSPFGLHCTISGSSSDAPYATTSELFTQSHMRLSAITSTESCASPNVFALPSTVTSAERRASVISAQQSSISTITLRNLASAQCFSKMLSKLGYESCFSVVV